MSDQQVASIVSALGGLGNIVSATNCMTRLRVVVAGEGAVDEAALRRIAAVLGLVHDRENYYEIVVGPGKAKSYANAVRDMMKGAGNGVALGANAAGGKTDHMGASAASAGALIAGPSDAIGAYDANAARPSAPSSAIATAVPSAPQQPSIRARFKNACKILGGIFVPLIPGFIVSGICGSFAMIIQQLVPGYSDDAFWGCLYNLLFLIQQSLLTYLTAWTGYRAAEQFGGTPILGGMLGMITSMSNINNIATFLGLYNADAPLSSVLMAGKGGVLAVVVGVFLLVKVEHFVDSRMPDVLKVIGTPLITMLVCAAVYVFAVMPVAGFVASWLCDGMEAVCMSENVFVRIIAGYVGAALFLPLVALGMHHGLVALYAIQLQAMGYVTLYPALCMAGAGQVGAAIAIRHKAKQCGNEKVVAVADAGIPAGFLGVGEPLVYGLTLPMGKPFITAGLGAGFGGAFVMFMQVAATAWGPSGLLGLCVMDAGPNGIAASLGAYAAGLLISYVMGFVITNVVVKTQDVAELYRDEEIGAPSAETPAAASGDAEAAEVADAAEAAAAAAAAAAEADMAGVDVAVADAAVTGALRVDAAGSNSVAAQQGDSDVVITSMGAANIANVADPASETAHGPEIAHGQPVALDDMILFAPADGQLIAQKQIADKTFSEGYLGSCFGVAPNAGTVFAPCEGTISLATDTHHAFVIETSQSQRVLVHVGLDTVSMHGAGFHPHVSVGDTVVVGQPLLDFDVDLVRANGYQDTIIVSLMK